MVLIENIFESYLENGLFYRNSDKILPPLKLQNHAVGPVSKKKFYLLKGLNYAS
jgi:hypothetical protein